MMNPKPHGVYFLANDRLIELTLAFLNSFRKYNPDIPLCLIPFRNDISLIESLKDTYHFSIYEDHHMLSYCDTLSLKFHPDIRGHYRKLAMWDGPFERFIYVDIDMVVLKNLDFCFRPLSDFDFIVSFSNLPSLRQWVWKNTISTAALLQPAQYNYAANTGFIISRRHAITKEMIQQAESQAHILAPHMELACMEQALINYIVVTSGLRYTSLFALMESPWYPENYTEFWAGNKRSALVDGKFTMLNGKMREVFLIHWAGSWQLRKWEIRLYILLNILKIKKNIWSIRWNMPFKKIWKHYRRLGPPAKHLK